MWYDTILQIKILNSEHKNIITNAFISPTESLVVIKAELNEFMAIFIACMTCIASMAVGALISTVVLKIKQCLENRQNQKVSFDAKTEGIKLYHRKMTKFEE